MTVTFPKQPVKRLPSWFRQEIPPAEKIISMKTLLHEAGLNTVCVGARCPNLGRCWAQKEATFMILGDVCTRSCRFCAVSSGLPLAPDPREPEAVARVVLKLGLRYVVITSVTRDDLPDKGAGHFAQTVSAIRRISPRTKIELLIPDFMGEMNELEKVVAGGPDVIGHNIETVPSLFPGIRARGDYARSLKILAAVKRQAQDRIFVKSGLMVGLGERDEEVAATLKDLRAAGCDILTIGQYLAPGKDARYVSAAEYLPPEKFREYEKTGLDMGFTSVLSGPLVRSSFRAGEAYNRCRKETTFHERNR